jgi:hypothetical protein
VTDSQTLADQAMAIHVIHRNLDLDELRACFDEMEARVEQLENHPAGTRCTG